MGLIDGLKVKYGVKIDPVLVGSDLLKIEDFSDLPNMIKPLTLAELRKFFRNQAKKLGMSVIEK